MAKSKTRIKAKEKKGIVKVTSMLKHDMLSYMEATNASKKSGKTVEANFITYVVAKVGDKVVYEASTSQFMSKNPVIKFLFAGKKGEEVTISWVDLKGNTDSKTAKIK